MRSSLEIQTRIFRSLSWADLEAHQRAAVEDIKIQTSLGILLISEPLPTFTFGRSSETSDCLWPADKMGQEGVSVHPVTRGGKWTYHGPGQLVVFPLFKMSDLGMHRHAVHRFLIEMRLAALRFILGLGVSAEVRNEPFGIYVGERKLVSFGISIEGGISRYGLALYLKKQTPYFGGIHPCGDRRGAVTSLEEEGYELSWETACNQLVDILKKSFQDPENALGFFPKLRLENTHDRAFTQPR